MTKLRSYTQKRREQRVDIESPPDQFQPRSFTPQAKAATESGQSGTLQTALTRSQRYGHTLENVAVNAADRAERVTLQPQLTVGEPGDHYEQEADAVAAQVVDRLESFEASPRKKRRQSDSEPIPPSQSIQPLVQTQTEAASPAANTHLEGAIAGARGSGDALSDPVRQPLERSFGADFSGVKIHTDAESHRLNRSLGSRAFTTQQDIFFKQGEYNPNTRSGKELLAHELTHVVQQNGSTVQRRSSAQPVVPSVQRLTTSGILQRKSASVVHGESTHLREFQRSATTGAYVVLEKKQIGPNLKGNKFVLDVDDATPDSTGQWLKAKVTQGTTTYEGFIRANKVKFAGLGVTGAREVADEAARGNTLRDGAPVHEAEGQTLDNLADVTDLSGGKTTDPMANALDTEHLKQRQGSLLVDKENASESISGHKNRLDATAGVADTVGGLVAMAQAVKSYKESESRMDKTGAVLSGVGGVSQTVAGGTKAVDSIAKSSGKDKGVGDSDIAGKWTGSVGDAISSVKEAFFTVKSIYDLYTKATSDEGASKGEVFRGVMDTILGLLKTAASVVKSVKGFLEIAQGGVNAALASTIPGLTIAISGATIAVKVYNILWSHVSSKRMKAMRQQFKQKSAGKDYLYQYTRKTGIITKTDKTTNKVDLLKLQARKLALETKETANTITPEEQQELHGIREYELASEMKYINKKRKTRAGIQIGIEMTKIAGDIATLTGQGAVAGVPLKMLAGGTEVGMSVTRRVKQYGRDRAAQTGAWEITKKVFNAEKSSDKKHAKRVRDTEVIFQMIAKLPAHDPNVPTIVESYQRVEHYIIAAGCEPHALYRLNGDIPAQKKLLIESMKQRE
ncbi:DUF4157 domain-containing protein [Pantanalinema rosaneae CENA516]|uniref:eCIS core domain-containing protein n=1 Tax=Pantanalinema rosaneae TaxID=1620701 RepID=UPI003D6F6D79